MFYDHRVIIIDITGISTYHCKLSFREIFLKVTEVIEVIEESFSEITGAYIVRTSMCHSIIYTITSYCIVGDDSSLNIELSIRYLEEI
jgi:hypothetical protein